ncbi:TIGR04282 family arsenosugar biosynthesis glycosyltransferase [Telluribacter sp. SYSU D00476]|uniref:TIGR04282 family arsenosugar biosynthesis glycosyltransferase n=1 Tax=Telluribacter sp. SYSU D00476 TaxID=2811430 RepID=UPI001FF2223B|nr:TIGR04282 family arsenosugar biosynthesis glycosyltransferase [Telluribacter sp. SYSU D00476]
MPLNALIIFVKNPIEGKVKTRLAKTVGHTRAVEVYRELLDYTRDITDALSASDLRRTVYYGDFVNEDDLWNGYDKALQTEGDLGLRMQEAFREQFAAGAGRVVIIGSDCLDLQVAHLQQAFDTLLTTEVVLGPSTDGGYYLLGMTRLHETLFEEMPWSQPELLEQTISRLQQHGIRYQLLDTLSDIDEWDDYLQAKERLLNRP